MFLRPHRLDALTVTLSAALLFVVQPLLAKVLLSWFGGSPSVWTTCLFFFQFTLLGGYAYAHATTRLLTPARQARLHRWLLIAAALSLLVQGLFWKRLLLPEHPPAALLSVPVVGLLVLLLVSVALPFFALSATSPLIQRWSALRDEKRSPYALFAFSNLGSLFGLFVFPLLLERLFGFRAQALLWGAGFVCFAALSAAAGSRQPETGPVQSKVVEGAPPSWRRVARWIPLALIPSALLSATTAQITQDLAPVPFLWVLPLALYLLSFVIAFEGNAFYRRVWCVPLFALSAWFALSVTLRGPAIDYSQQVAAPCLALFAASILCHGELYRRRPDAAHLTGFYLWVSVGGVLGSGLITFVAPGIFPNFEEYPLLLGAAALVAAWVTWRSRGEAIGARRMVLGAASALFALHLAGAWMAVQEQRSQFVWAERNFFGVVRVMEWREKGAHAGHHLFNGRIEHGRQRLPGTERPRPTAYYGATSGLPISIDLLRNQRGSGEGLNVGVVGLGLGTVALHFERADRLTFFEINPAVIAVAKGSGGYFDVLAQSRAPHRIVLGDARVALAAEREASHEQYDLIIGDAFSGDAIPAHLISQEALKLYLDRLAPDGILAMHVSNKHLDLEPVLGFHASTFGLSGWWFDSRPSNEDESRAQWVFLARKPEVLGDAAEWSDASREVRWLASDRLVTWTDEQNNLLELMRFKPLTW